MKNYSVIIIGGGSIGTFTMYHLAKQGIENVLLIEKESQLGKGATGAWGSLIHTFHKDLETTRNAAQSISFFDNFKENVGQSCHFNKTGSLYFLKKKDLHLFEQHFNAMKQHSISFKILSAQEGKSLFPQFYWFEDDIAIYEPLAGTACPDTTTKSLVEFATQHNCHLKLKTKVAQFISEGDSIKGVITESGEQLFAEKVILAAGIWSHELLPEVDTEFNIQKKKIQINRFIRNHTHAPEAPLFFDMSQRTFGHFFPNGSFAGGYLKSDLEEANLDHIHNLNISEANKAKQKISLRLNWIKNAKLEGGIWGIENYTTESPKSIRLSKRYKNLLPVTGWNCAGFTTAPIIGERIAKNILS